MCKHFANNLENCLQNGAKSADVSKTLIMTKPIVNPIFKNGGSPNIGDRGYET